VPGINVVNRALVVSVVGQLIYVVWHVAWRFLVGKEVATNWRFALLSFGEMIQVSFFAISIVYGGGDMIHFYFLRYDGGPQKAEEGFVASMGDLASHPFRRVRTLTPLWVVFLLIWSFTFLLPVYLSRRYRP
jgi:hypothetical protein